MKTKSVIQSEMEVMDATQLSKIKGGTVIYIIVDGKRIPVIIPD
jgi:hypothetical protein